MTNNVDTEVYFGTDTIIIDIAQKEYRQLINDMWYILEINKCNLDRINNVIYMYGLSMYQNIHNECRTIWVYDIEKANNFYMHAGDTKKSLLDLSVELEMLEVKDSIYLPIIEINKHIKVTLGNNLMLINYMD